MGKRASLEPAAIRLYADGATLDDISGSLGVSVTTLSAWKTSTRDPSTGVDEWEKARTRKQSNIVRLRSLFDRQISYIEGLAPDDISAPMMDTLSKLGALIERWDRVERAQQVADEVAKQVKAAGLSDQAVGNIRRKILGISE